MLYPACFLFFAAVVLATFKGEENLSEWHITRFLTQRVARKPSTL